MVPFLSVLIFVLFVFRAVFTILGVISKMHTSALTNKLIRYLSHQFQCSPGVIATLQKKIMELEKMCKVCSLHTLSEI